MTNARSLFFSDWMDETVRLRECEAHARLRNPTDRVSSPSRRGAFVQRALYAVLLLLAPLTPSLAEVRIEASPGGEAMSFIHFFEALRQTHQRVVIDGPCFSACTLVLIIVPRSRICVTRRAVFGFHAAKAIDQFGREYPAPDVTRAVAAAYPAPIRNWISRHGGLTGAPIFLDGRELSGVYPLCR
jgi:hypothetical protein